VGPRAGLDRRKVSSLPGFDPGTVQPVVSRYTDFATRPYIHIYIYTTAQLKGKGKVIPLQARCDPEGG